MSGFIQAKVRENGTFYAKIRVNMVPKQISIWMGVNSPPLLMSISTYGRHLLLTAVEIQIRGPDQGLLKNGGL